MIEVTKSLRWALIVFSITIATDGQELASVSPASFYASSAACTDEGNRILSVIDAAEGVEIRFACIPREAARESDGTRDGA